MKLSRETTKLIQRELTKGGYGNLVPDGIAGNKTLMALMCCPQIPNRWPLQRQLIGFIQYLCVTNQINPGVIDGYWGPQTDYGYSVLKTKLQTGHLPAPWREEEADFPRPKKNKWPVQTTANLNKFYGSVGTNQSKCYSPYPLRIAWDKRKKVSRFTCHKKIVEPTQRVLQKTLDYYGRDEIKRLGLDLFGGCLNVRKIRGGTAWSTHSWGISIDWDPERNRLRWGKNKANFARPEYDPWWSFWEQEGAVPLGRVRNFDWMHIQFATIRKR